MTVSRFYVMHIVRIVNGWWLKSLTIEQLEKLDAFFLGAERPTTPQQFKLRGRRRMDVISCEGYYFISERHKNVFRKNKLAGWDTYAIQFKRGKQTIKEFSGLIITGRADTLSKNHANWFDVHTWDGTDLFTSPRGGYKFATDKARQVIINSNIPGFEFDPIDPNGIVEDDLRKWERAGI